MTDLREYLDTFFGYEGAYGYLHFALADPYLNDWGQLNHRDWTPVSFEWPVGALHEGDFLRAILSDALEHDIFICPYLRSERRRDKGCPTACWFVHSEVDGGLDTGKVEELGGFAVATGTPGQGQVYVPLTRSVNGHEDPPLCRALGGYLGAKDTEIRGNDLMRPPGTFNQEPTVRGGQPTPVTWLVRPNGNRVEPETLARRLGLDLAKATESVALWERKRARAARRVIH